MKRKILAGLLSLCMMVSLVPTAAFAEEATPAEGTPVVCAGVAETECLAEEHIEGCDKYVAPKATEEPAPTETPAEEPVVASLEEETPAPVAKVNETGYATLTEALAAAKTMAGEVVVEIYDKVTFAEPLLGSYDSITFVGKDTDAEIHLDVQGYTTATGKKVAFENLKLSKSEGGYVANAGFMNLAFGIYDVKEVTYTNCIFANGAYASSGKVTFTGCTFHPSHDRYGMWAYGDAETIIDNCKFESARGIKMYSEDKVNKEASSILTVKNTDFSKADGKPAIVLTYGESVTLENNTYPSTGVFELDLDGVPNGTPISFTDNSGDKLVCVNDNGDCGVLVDGKIYTTVAQAKEAVEEGSKVTLLHESAETVELPAGTVLERNGFTAAGVTVATPVAEVNDIPYASLASAIEAAENGDTVVLHSDLTIVGETFTIADDKSITLDMNGYKITATDNKAANVCYELFYIYGGLKVIGEGTIELTSTSNDTAWAKSSTIFHNRGGVLAIEGGTYKHLGGTCMAYVVDNNANSYGDATTTINAGTLSSSYIAIRNRMDTYGANGGGNGIPTLNVNYGELTGKYAIWGQVSSAGVKGNININDGMFTAAAGKDAVIVDTDSNPIEGGIKTAITGGKFTSDPAAYVADGYYAYKDGENWGVEPVDAKNVSCEAELLAALAAGATEIVLDADVELSTGIVVSKDLTLDLNGKTLSAAENQSSTALIKAESAAKLTITGNGTVNSASLGNDYSIAVWAKDGAEVTIKNGKFTNVGAKAFEDNGTTPNNNELIYVSGTGKIVIEDGEFIGNTENTTYKTRYTLNKQDGCEGTITVSGGKFCKYDPSSSLSENPVGNFVAADKHVCADGDNYVVHGTTAVAEKAATCGGTGTKAHYTCKAGTLFNDAAGKNIVTAESLVIAAKGHSFGDWITTKGATCARNGEETRTCACGAAEVRETGKSSMHGYGADGKCATCGAADPNYVAPVATPAPTAKPTTAPAATPAPTATPEATPAPEMPKEADTTITEVVVKEEVVEAVKETVTVTEGTATVEKATVEAVIEATEEDAPVVLPLAQVTEETAEVVNKAEVATEALETVAEAEKDVVIELTDVTVMLDAEAVKAITEQAEGKTIEIRAVKTETHTLTEKQQATLADKDTAIVVTAQIFSDGEYIGDFKGGKATIMLPFQPEEGRAAEDYAVYFIDDHGELVAVPAEYVDGHMVFTTVHFSDYVIVYEGEAFGGSTEIVVPEAPAAESGFPVLPIAIVIAIIIIGGVIILMKKKNAEE